MWKRVAVLVAHQRTHMREHLLGRMPGGVVKERLYQACLRKSLRTAVEEETDDEHLSTRLPSPFSELWDWQLRAAKGAMPNQRELVLRQER